MIRLILFILFLIFLSLVYFFPNFFIINILEHSVPAIFSSLGVASIALLVMLFHYWIKKFDYRSNKEKVGLMIKRLEEYVNFSEKNAKEVYSIYNVKDLNDYMKKMLEGKLKHNKLADDLLIKIYGQIANSKLQIMFYKKRIDYYDNYSFSHYIIGHLDKIYPDKNYEKLYKKQEEELATLRKKSYIKII